MITSLVNAKRFYKITRYIFGLNKAIKPYLDTMNRELKTNPFRQTKAIQAIIEELGRFRQKQTRLGAWLTGTDQLVCLLREEISIADQKLEAGLKEKQQREKTIEPKVNGKGTQQTHAEVMKYFKNRVACVEQAPLKKPLCAISCTVDRFGIHPPIKEEIDLEGLRDFIEKPSQEFKEEKELKEGVEKVIFFLEKNPTEIMNIIKNHPYIPATFLLEDLADKMKKQDRLKKLELLFDQCSDELISACIYNLSDLKRCLKAFPSYLDKIMKSIISKEDYFKRIFESEQNSEETLKKIAEQYGYCEANSDEPPNAYILSRQ